jgi:two-component system OmpR family sensor kinase/two-component system sensor histidine kinase QseC
VTSSSLRKQLLIWLVPFYVVAALAAAVCTHYMYGVMVSYFMDTQLGVFADSHAASSGPAPALRPLTEHEVEKGAFFVQIWDRDGRLLSSSFPSLRIPRSPDSGFKDVELDGEEWRVYSLHSPDRTVQSVQSLAFRDMIIREQALQSGLPIAALIPISIFILWFGIRPALRRLQLVSKAAAAQDAYTVGELPIEHAPTEIRPLVSSVNTLLARLRSEFASKRRFVQDAAHELRTPITAMSLQLENLKTRITDPTTVQQLAQLEGGLARTKRLVEQLLHLARQDSPTRATTPTTVRVSDLLKSAIAHFMVLADRRRIDLGFAASVDAEITGNADELRSLVDNLLDNALRYTPEGGIVDVALHYDAGVVTAEIVDSGPGIPTELLPRVFDRFYRIEGTDTEGSGLGLAIARNAAERNHIDLDLSNRIDCSGLIARLRFRAAAIVPAEDVANRPFVPSDTTATGA